MRNTAETKINYTQLGSILYQHMDRRCVMSRSRDDAAAAADSDDDGDGNDDYDAVEMAISEL